MEPRARPGELQETVAHDLSAALPDPEPIPLETRSIPSDPMIDGHIGPWRIVRELGEGGFGLVYLGERKNPAQRSAIKVIKPGMDTRAVLARFEAERQALAILSHPNIARLYEPGVHEGRPYFAMEYVPGIPITEYADKRRMGIRERLQLFQQVCRAIEHAHHKAIIHRDISSRNVLVADVDQQPVAKVIDFGIAKAIGMKLTDRTIDSNPMLVVGNYAYMSPEQADPTMDVDTRTDVYSLGVLLYELLAGSRPLMKETLVSAGDDAVRRMIRDEEAPRPSTRLSTLANAEEVARQRQTRLEDLRGTLRGELEYIPLMALRKERERRYQSPEKLSADIDAYLAGRPLVAHPESSWYRARKFFRRHAVPLAVAGAFAVLAAGGTAAYLQRVRADDRIQRRLAAQAESGRASAEGQADFIKRMMGAADPVEAGGRQLSAAEAVKLAARQLDAGAMKADPAAEAGLRSTVGRALVKVGDYAAAEPQLQAAAEYGRAHLDADPRTAAVTANDLAALMQERGRMPEAERLLTEAVAGLRARAPANDPDLLMTVENLGMLYRNSTRADRAEPLLREAYAGQRARNSDRDAARTGHRLALALFDQHREGEADAILKDALALARQHAGEWPTDLADVLSTVGDGLQRRKSYAPAELALREALDLYRGYYPPGHPALTQAVDNLVQIMEVQNKVQEANDLQKESLKAARAGLMEPRLARMLFTYGQFLEKHGNFAPAEVEYREAAQIQRNVAPGTPEMKEYEERLAAVRAKQVR